MYGNVEKADEWMNDLDLRLNWNLEAMEDKTVQVVPESTGDLDDDDIIEEMMELALAGVLGELEAVDSQLVVLYAIVEGMYGPHLVVREGKIAWEDRKRIYRWKYYSGAEDGRGEIIETTT